MSSNTACTIDPSSRVAPRAEDLQFPKYGHAMSASEAFTCYDSDTRVAFVAPHLLTALDHEGNPYNCTALSYITNFPLDNATEKSLLALGGSRAAGRPFVDGSAIKLCEADLEARNPDAETKGPRIALITAQTFDDLLRKQITQGQSFRPLTTIDAKQKGDNQHGQSAFHSLDQVKSLFLGSEDVKVVAPGRIYGKDEDGNEGERYYSRVLHNNRNPSISPATYESERSAAGETDGSQIVLNMREQRARLKGEDI